MTEEDPPVMRPEEEVREYAKSLPWDYEYDEKCPWTMFQWAVFLTLQWVLGEEDDPPLVKYEAAKEPLAQRRAKWIEKLRALGDRVRDPFLLAVDVLMADQPEVLRTPAEWRQEVADAMGLVDRDGHERGEPLGDSIRDMWFNRRVPCGRIADALESGRHWREWP